MSLMLKEIRNFEKQTKKFAENIDGLLVVYDYAVSHKYDIRVIPHGVRDFKLEKGFRLISKKLFKKLKPICGCAVCERRRKEQNADGSKKHKRGAKSKSRKTPNK